MNRHIYRALNIRPTESRLVGRLLLLQFLLGIGNGIITVSSLGLLVGKYMKTEDLSLVYMLSALLLFPINGIYVRLDLKYAPRQLLQIVIITASLSLLGATALWYYGPHASHWLAITIVSWILMVYMITGYGYWGVAAVFFNVRESRRVFSVIGSGDLPGKMLAYALFYQLYHGKYALETAMLIAAAVFFIAYVVNKLLLSDKALHIHKNHDHGHDHDHDKDHGHDQHHNTSKKWWQRIFESQLILRIAMLSMLGYAILHLVEYTFIDRIKTEVKNVDVSKFVSQVLFAGSAIALLFKLIFSSRIISKFGLARSLLIMPLLTIAIATIILGFNFDDAAEKVNLYGFGMIYVFTPILRSIMLEPVFFILFQPLNIHLRLKGHIIAKGYVYPPALLFVGLLLYYAVPLFTKSDLIPFVLIIIIILSLAIILIINFINVSYVKAVTDSVQKGFFGGLGVFVNNDKVTRTLLEKILFGKEAEKIHALDILHRSNYDNYEKLVATQLPQASNAYRAYLLNIIRKENFSNIIPLVKQLHDAESNEQTKERLFEVLCELDSEFAYSNWEQGVGKSISARRIMLLSIIGSSHPASAGILDRIKKDAESHEEEMHLLLSVLHKTNAATQEEILSKLTSGQSSSDVLHRLIIKATGQSKQHQFAPYLLQFLSNNQYKQQVKDALLQLGDDLFHYHNKELQQLSHTPTKVLLDVASTTRTSAAQQFLLAMLESNPRLELETVDALYRQGLVADASQAKALISKFETCLERALAKMQTLLATPASEDDETLFRSIKNELDSDTISSLKLLRLSGDYPFLNRVIDLIDKKQKSSIHNAIELLDLTISKSYFEQLAQLIDYVLLDHHPAASFGRSKAEHENSLYDRILKDPNAYSVWTRSLAWYMAAKRGNKSVVQSIQNLSSVRTHPMEEETRQFVISSFAKQ